MNSVSWFIYIADVLGNISAIALMCAAACAVFCVVCLTGQAATDGGLSKDCPNMWRYWWRCAAGCVLLSIFASLIPSKNTMYAIAASQMGERVIESEQVRGIADDATKAVHQWIKQQIAPEK